MVAQIQVFDAKDDDECVDCFDIRYSTLELAKGYFIRAAIDYLTVLSAKILSKQLLIDEGIIDADSEEAAFSENVIIPNYRYRIDSALLLLQTWSRQPTESPGWDMYKTPEFTTNEYGGVPIEQFVEVIERCRRRFEAWEKGPRPMIDSIMPAGVSLEQFYDYMGDCTYWVDRIPKTLPHVLHELELQGLHHFIANKGRLDYAYVQEVVAFMDKVIAYVPVGEDGDMHKVAQGIRDAFAGCPEGGYATIG